MIDINIILEYIVPQTIVLFKLGRFIKLLYLF